MLPRSAARRIALVAFLAYAAAMLALGISVFYATHAAFSRQIDTSIEQTTRALLVEYRDDGVRGISEAIAQQRGPGPISLGTALYDPTGQRIAGNLLTPMPAPGWQRIVFSDPEEGPDPARAKVTALSGGYRLAVAADLESLEAIDRTILSMFGIAMGFLLLLGIGGAMALAAYLRRRLSSIEATAGAIIRGDLDRRAAVSGADDEFDRVAASLNSMLDRIAGLIANLRQVSGDLAHDLRTPLTRLRNQLERLRSDGLTAAKEAQADEALAQADSVLSLFGAILRISEVEEGSLRRAFAAVDLSSLTRELGETLTPLAEDARRVLDIEVADDLIVTGDRELLAQAIINLVENALRHTPEGSRIALTARSEEVEVVLTVSDDGPGIAEGDRERVQQRFVRLEAARSTDGHGLGLSLVRAIADMHGAKFVLGDAAPGLVAQIRLPQRATK